VIDLHSHVLPGLDDGAADLVEALAICRAAAADGIEVLAATPHVRAHDWPTPIEAIDAAFAELVPHAEGIIRLVPGAELDLEELRRPPEELRRFALAGNPKYLLVESPYHGWPLDMAERLFELRMSGFTPVLAHPERAIEVQERPELVEPLVRGGALLQLTAGSLDGRMGRRAKASAFTLLERGWAHLIASDGHAAHVRAIGMRTAREAVGDDALARWLTEDVPRAIVDDTPVPPRPEPEKKKRFGVF
jgi:protein-tyrosine phosphatase